MIDEIIYWLGQGLGFVAFALTFLSYQCKTQKKLLVVQSIATLLILISYGLLGATAGMTLNICCILRNVIYFNKDKKIFSSKWIPYVLAVLMAVVSVFSWQGPVTLLITAGLMINTVFLSFDNPQRLRYSILLTSSLVLIYNVYVFSMGGICNEVIAITSSIIGIIRYRRIN